MSQKSDVIVIGGGAGTKLVTPPSKLGKKVTIIEKESMGGTCLNRGCIPSKMMIYPAELCSFIREAQKIQIKSKVEVDFKNLVKRISKTVDGESQDIEIVYSKNPFIHLIKGEAKFISNKVVEVNGQNYTADKIIIATGSKPYIPKIKGLDKVPFMTSREALRKEKLPKTLTVIGGGFIALELGYAYSSFGSKVNFIVRSNMLRKKDKDIREEFEKIFSQNHSVYLKTNPMEVSYNDGEFHLLCSQNEKKIVIKSEELLIATGVVPCTDNLGLENTSINLNNKKYIQVNEFLETTVPNIYALGDVIGKYFFRHSANFEGEYLFKNLFLSNEKKPIQYPEVPQAVFTHPQIASVGKTEDELIKKNIEYIVGKNSYKNSAMGMARLSEYGFVKILVDKKNHKILGAHIIGDEASSLIHFFILLLKLNGTLEDMLEIIYVHPALPEIIRNTARKAKELL